jgi:hypothetical protein
MKAKKGYHWQLPEQHAQVLSDAWRGVYIKTDWFEIDGNAKLIILAKGYAWDGASGIPDDLKVVRGSAVHDALYQAMRLGLLDHNKYRLLADLEFKYICQDAGMSWLRAQVIYFGVRALANFAVDPSQESRVVEVP